jgi:hypothetical protein
MVGQNATSLESEATQLYDEMQTHSLTPIWKIEEALMPKWVLRSKTCLLGATSSKNNPSYCLM